LRRARRNRKRSSLEKLVYSWLEEDKILFKKEYPIGKCHVDILFPPRTVIELNGCHWHACGVCHNAITPEQQEIQVKDSRRYAFFRNRSYDVITIWEHEINDEPDRVRAMLRGIAKV
jgi:very-short-patch-repair endonuclease